MFQVVGLGPLTWNGALNCVVGSLVDKMDCHGNVSRATGAPIAKDPTDHEFIAGLKALWGIKA
jgi:hypothetical protein